MNSYGIHNAFLKSSLSSFSRHEVSLRNGSTNISTIAVSQSVSRPIFPTVIADSPIASQFFRGLADRRTKIQGFSDAFLSFLIGKLTILPFLIGQMDVLRLR